MDNENSFLCWNTLESASKKIIELSKRNETYKKVSNRISKSLYLPWSEISKKYLDFYKKILNK
jgi:hypothetical protein